MSERDLIERLAIRAARFEASPGNDLIYGQGEAQTDKEAAATIARLSEALAEAEKKGVEAERRLETVREAAFDEALKFIASRAHAALASRRRDISEGGEP